jgi:VCBS repeat-containing protein
VRVIATGSFKLLNGFTLDGDFTFSTGLQTINGTSQAVMFMAADATLQVLAGTVRVFNLNVTSNLVIWSSGVAARLTVTRSAGPTSSLGFTAASDMTFKLEVNTSSSSVTIPGSSASIASGVRVIATGDFTISGFTLSGVFTLTDSGSTIAIGVNSTFSFLGATLNADGDATIAGGSDPGIALSLTLKKGSGNTSNITEVPGFDISGTFTLQLNTRNTTTTGVTGNTFRVHVTGASVTIAAFTLGGSADFAIVSGKFRADVSLTASLWGFRTFTFNGWIRSDGYFDLHASKSVDFSDSGNGFDGSLKVGLSRDSGGYSFSGDADGTLKVFNVTLASLDGWITESGKVKFTIDIFGFSGTVGFNLANDGSFFDGPVAGATVFFDANLNMTLDTGEPSAITDGDGEYHLVVPLDIYDTNGNGIFDLNEGQLVGIGGIDTFTGLPVTVPVRAPATALGSGVPTLLSPVSSLYTSLLQSGLTVDQANGVLVRAAGNDSAVTGLLSIRDLSENLTFGTPDAFEFYRLGVQLQTAAEQIAALLDGAAGVSAAAAADGFYRQLAATLTAPGAPSSDAVLGSAAGVSQLTAAISASLGVTVDSSLLNGASEVINSTFGRIESIAFATTALSDVARVQIVGQGTAAAALHDAAAGVTPIGTVVGQYTGGGLNDAIAATPSPDIQLPPVEPPTLGTVITTLPDGTTQITVTTRTSDPVLDPTEFELTVPVPAGKRMALTQLTIEANDEEGGPAVLEIRTSLDGYQSVIARVATSLDVASYQVTLDLSSSTTPVTVRIFAVEPVEPTAAFDFIKVIATGVVLPFNLAPTANDDSYVTNQNTPLTVASSGVLANDTDIEGDTLTAVLNSGPSHGTVTLNANGSFSYSATAGYTGSDRFTYRANDGTSLSVIATVTITIKPVAPPVVTAPASITIAATSAAGATAGTSQLLAAFLASGSAVDPTDPAPVRLTPQINGVDVTASTQFGIGTTAVTFRYRNSSGQIGTATSYVNLIVGTISISNSITGKGVDASGNYYVDLTITNTGTGYAMNLAITESSFRTLTGTGTVSLLNPGSIAAGNLEAGTSTTIRILLSRPVSVKRFSFTQNMTFTDVTGVKLSTSSSQAIIP